VSAPKPWPNGLGFDVRARGGEWEVLVPATAAQPFRARFIPRGERYPSRYGEGPTAEAAITEAEAIS
jgi:hypothetical protein